jgi:hypothetical protein
MNLLNKLVATTKRKESINIDHLYTKKLISDFKIISELNGFIDINVMNLLNNIHEIHSLKNAPALELGVFCGRSLVALASITSVKTVGVDPFFDDFNNHYALPEEAKYLKKKSGGHTPQQRIDKIYEVLNQIDQKNETKISKLVKLEKSTQEEFLRNRDINEKFQFIYIDAEHSFKAVKDVLDEFNSLLLPSSWVVIDDFLAPGFPGITEAVYRHSSFKNTLFPIMYGFNKAIFIFRPDSNTMVTNLQKQLYLKYKENEYLINPQHDGTLYVQIKN